MGKSAATRWTDTIKYLNAASPFAVPRIGDHLNTLVTGPVRTTISEKLSLGSTAGVHKSTKANENVRHALRALLLCQRVYFSDLWAKSSSVGGSSMPDSTFLDPNWKSQSLSYWGMRSEADIRSAIAMFAVVPTAVAADVSDAAMLGPPTGEPPRIAGNLNVSRLNFTATGAAETCYRGVLAWLLKSGVVSFRWFMKNSVPTGSAALNELFGDGEVVWAGKDFTDTSVLPTIEKGFVVHMRMENTGEFGWNGHWVISNGDGTICGVNNGEVKKPGETVIKKYTNDGTLRSQFEGYAYLVKETPDKLKPQFLNVERTGYAKARMVKFDPLSLPGRM